MNEQTPTRTTKTYEMQSAQGSGTSIVQVPVEVERVDEFTALDSYEATQNASGKIQLHIKLYRLPDENDGEDIGWELAQRLKNLESHVKGKGFQIAGDG